MESAAFAMTRARTFRCTNEAQNALREEFVFWLIVLFALSSGSFAKPDSIIRYSKWSLTKSEIIPIFKGFLFSQSIFPVVLRACRSIPDAETSSNRVHFSTWAS